MCDMLREMKWVSQIEGEPQRRWFADHELDLIIWQDDSHIVGFELCYDKTDQERALSWQSTDGFRHSWVDSGEIHPGRPKPAPLLVPCVHFDVRQVARKFLDKSRSLERDVAEFIYDKLLEYRQAA